MSPKASQPADQTAKSYIARPTTGAGPGVLVLHAWWGLNPFCREFCDRLAGAGFVVLAPDLYHGRVAATIEEAQKLRSTLKQATVQQEISQAAEQIGVLCEAGAPGIGVVGFSLGGREAWALWLADQPASPVVATVSFP